MPARNAAAILPGALESVARQTARPAAVIVIDDGSTDDTAGVASHRGATVIRRPTAGGAAAARNAGLRASETDFCAFLDADDEWHDYHLATLRRAVLEHPQAALWFSGSIRKAPGDYFAGAVLPGCESQEVRVVDLLLGRARPTTSATLVRRELALGIGGFDEHEDFLPASCEDLDLWLRLAQRHELRSVSAITVTYRVSDDRRLPATRRANQRARIRAVERALASAGLGDAERRAVWSATFLDLGKWNLKHGTHAAARRCLVRALAQSPWHAQTLGWLLLTLLPERTVVRARTIVRRTRAARRRRR